MMHHSYSVAKNGETIGKFTITEIVNMIASGELQITDFIFDEGSSDWIPLLGASFVMDHLNSMKPKSKPVASEPRNTNRTVIPKTSGGERPEWFVRRGHERLGPLRKHDVIRMMQEKIIHSHDFVWKDGDVDWVRFVERPEFAPRVMQEHWQQWSQIRTEDGPFLVRRSDRWKAHGHLLVHDGNRLLWKGEVDMISLGGIGVRMRNSACLPGEKVFIHVSDIHGLKAFTGTCEVVSKEYRRGVKRSTDTVGYGLRFLDVPADLGRDVETWARGLKSS